MGWTSQITSVNLNRRGQQRRRWLEEATVIKARPIIAYLDGVTSGRTSPWDIAAAVGLSGDPIAVFGWVPRAPSWMDDERLEGIAVIGGYGLAPAIAADRLRYVPVRLGAVPHFLATVARPAVAVVPGVRRADGFAYRGGVGWGPAAVALAEYVVIEVDDSAVDLGAPAIECTPDCVIDIGPQPPSEQQRPPDETDLVVGRNVVSLFPERASIQVGPGAIAEAIVAEIDRPVGIRTGLLTDSVASLLGRDLLVGTAVTGYVWGGEPIEELASAGRLDLQPIEVTHGLGVLSSSEGLVACNTALQVGLDGSVNVERVGSRLVAGIGGHADFCAGASRAPGGISVIALRSTTRSGSASTIVERVDVVSTPRCDVDVVVTEHGIADLRGLDDAERAVSIAGVAAPEYRAGLLTPG